ncbi:MAG: hypothetical protein JWP66_1944 [Naasia sp.]|nr:hypothetical protein [Naasia sp.]
MTGERGSRRGALRLLAAFALLPLAGCAAPPPPAETPPPVLPAVDYAAPAPTEIAPLRGTTVPAGSLDHPALAAKIDDHEAARPQIGLERADLVFEELVEGGLTRYVAVWHSDLPELVGPVRSIRPMDPNIISPFGGIVAYSGGQPQFVEMMQSTGVHNAVHGQPDTEDTFFRAPDRPPPHDVLVRAPELVAGHSDLAAPAHQFAYALDAASSSAGREGEPITRIDAAFSESRYPAWVWDPGGGRYLRLQEGEPDLDISGAQFGAVNAVVLRVTIDWRYDYVPETVLEGSGEAWVSTGGRTLHGTWSKDAPESPIALVDDRGFPIRLGAGNTWFELLPEDATLTLTP